MDENNDFNRSLAILRQQLERSPGTEITFRWICSTLGWSQPQKPSVTMRRLKAIASPTSTPMPSATSAGPVYALRRDSNPGTRIEHGQLDPGIGPEDRLGVADLSVSGLKFQGMMHRHQIQWT